MFAVVSFEHAGGLPYPVVFVSANGRVHELDEDDRDYMEEMFHPGDGGRPYVKKDYASKNSWGSVEGFCFRKDIPATLEVLNERYRGSPQNPLSSEEMTKLKV